MAYVSGTAADINALLTNIRTACTSNGWTLSGNVLHKGNAYIDSTVSSGYIHWRGGTGKDASNVLTGAAPNYSRTGSFATNAIAFPVNYEAFIFSDPDEVFVVINYSTNFYQFVMFGLSDVAGLPGTGCYVASSRNAGTAGGTTEFASSASLNGFNIYLAQGMMPFWEQDMSGNPNTNNSFIHHGLDGGGWSRSGSFGTGAGYARSAQFLTPLISSLPNAWNNETVLLPFPIYCDRTSGNKVSLVADLKNLRHCRIDYHDPGSIITLGTDEWKVYPWYKKNTVARNGNDIGTVDSGTFGYAVRYDGG